MANLKQLKQDRAFALNKAENILAVAEKEGRELTETEVKEYDVAMAAVNNLAPQIADLERHNTLRLKLIDGKLIPGNPNLRLPYTPAGLPTLTVDYFDSFHRWLASRGQNISASLHEGTGSAGGYVVPVVVDQNIVPLVPSEMGVRSIATVVPTSSDIKIPRGKAFGAGAAIKAESQDSTHSFAESNPELDQFTLSAFMGGHYEVISWELAQDAPSFQTFCVRDLTLALQMFEEGKYVNGTGTGEAEGLIGNTGEGVTGVQAGSDSYGSELIEASFDVLAKLNAAYHSGASFLMTRATASAIRKAQNQANSFIPVFTREGGVDRLHGYPVVYSSAMPEIAAGNTPVLFGDFKAGYVIGDRGGAGINVKILDQPKALEGQLIILAYRRTDGRVRRAEAIQAITLEEVGS